MYIMLTYIKNHKVATAEGRDGNHANEHTDMGVCGNSSQIVLFLKILYIF